MKLAEVIKEMQAKGREKQALLEQPKLESVEWKTAKKDLSTWSRDYSKHLEQNHKRVRHSTSGKYSRMELSMGTINGFEAQLVVYEPQGDKGETKAFFSLFNSKENLAYVHKLTD